ncbi:MAG: adenosylcobinamide-phosphate synthase CbiB [Rhodospirillaceae bacterium]|nr:adenosylcobinamide-phosphate synthase CbiB [Rhodospirillaceae bacterium]
MIGYPGWLHRLIPHPVAWIAAAIAALDRRWNHPGRARKFLGVVTMLAIVGLSAGAGIAIIRVASHIPYGGVLVVLIATLGLAQRSLFDHVAAVIRAFNADDLPAARTAVGRIVGRDVTQLDQSGVAAAALESLAESFNDGVVAPAFWLFLGGLPGLFAYKAVNTADSMIGHREPRWRDFGWAAARTDDVMNLIPARLTGGLIAIAGRGGWRVMFRDARKHASPNAGWPEAAMAGALKVELGGPASYDGVMHDRPTFGAGPRPGPHDLGRGLMIFLGACWVMWGLLAVGGLIWRP